MSIKAPRLLPEMLITIGEMSEASEADGVYRDFRLCRAEAIKKDALKGGSFAAAVFETVNLSGYELAGSDFTDVIFRSCNFSGADLSDCYFKRCLFDSVKAVGACFTDSRFHDTAFTNTMLGSANFTGSKFDAAELTDCTAAGIFLSGCVFKKTEFTQCDLSGGEFCESSLDGIDVSSCIFEGIRVSEGAPELRGLTVNAYQATELVKLLGVKISDGGASSQRVRPWRARRCHGALWRTAL